MHETDRIITQRYVKKKYGKKMQSKFTKYKKNVTKYLLQTTWTKRVKILFLIEIKQSKYFECMSCKNGMGNLEAPNS